MPDEGSQSEPCTPASFADYSDLFGDEFQIPEYQWDSKFTNVLDIGLVEEGILHVLYACVSQVNHNQSCLLRINHRSSYMYLYMLLRLTFNISFLTASALQQVGRKHF